MRDVILVLCVLGIFYVGYAAMGRLDQFLATRPFQDEPGTPAHPSALVFVEASERALIGTALQRYGPWVRSVADPAAPGDCAAAVVLAASASDLDNILLCAQAAKHGATDAVALCNDAQYQFVYLQYGVAHVARNLNEAVLAFEQLLKERFDHDD